MRRMNRSRVSKPSAYPAGTMFIPAKPTTLGQWALAYADAMLRNLAALEYTWEEYNSCPLGAVENPIGQVMVLQSHPVDGAGGPP